MTRELLLEYICPGYRTPDCFKGDISFNCSDCNHVLNEMLDKYDKQIREDAIDDFANWLVEQGILGNRCISDGEITDYGKVYAKKYKEQLKEQKNEQRNNNR